MFIKNLLKRIYYLILLILNGVSAILLLYSSFNLENEDTNFIVFLIWTNLSTYLQLKDLKV